MQLLGDKVLDTLQQGLNAAALRHQVTANNLANINTPGFKRGRVRFEEVLAQALQADSDRNNKPAMAVTQAGHQLAPKARPAVVRPEVYVDTSLGLRNDGNNVDPETENALLAENTLWYTAMSRLAADRFSLLRHAISEGRR